MSTFRDGFTLGAILANAIGFPLLCLFDPFPKEVAQVGWLLSWSALLLWGVNALRVRAIDNVMADVAKRRSITAELDCISRMCSKPIGRIDRMSLEARAEHLREELGITDVPSSPAPPPKCRSHADQRAEENIVRWRR